MWRCRSYCRYSLLGSGILRAIPAPGRKICPYWSGRPRCSPCCCCRLCQPRRRLGLTDRSRSSSRRPPAARPTSSAGSSATSCRICWDSGQGNRVKNSSCDETCEEVVVPSGDFAFESEAIFAGGFSDQIEGHVSQRGEIGGGVVGADTAFVVAEDHVHHPV